MTDDEPDCKLPRNIELAYLVRRLDPCAANADQLLRDFPLPLSRLDPATATNQEVKAALKVSLTEELRLLASIDDDDHEGLKALLKRSIATTTDLLEYADHFGVSETMARASAAAREHMFSLKRLLGQSPDGSKLRPEEFEKP